LASIRQQAAAVDQAAVPAPNDGSQNGTRSISDSINPGPRKDPAATPICRSAPRRSALTIRQAATTRCGHSGAVGSEPVVSTRTALSLLSGSTAVGKGAVMDQDRRAEASPARTAFLVGIPLLWIVVALVHPQGDGDVYDSLDDKVGLWLGVHFAQPVLSLGLAAVLWLLLAGRTSTTATVARVAIPVWLVSFAVFDSVTGIASGLAVHHANGLEGQEQQGAGSTAGYLVENTITADFSPVWFIQAAALLTAVIATALVLRAAGASRAVFVAMLIGGLLVFHAGPIAAVGLVALAVAFVLADRDGLMAHGHSLLPAA
jgi:hypothetical protein